MTYATGADDEAHHGRHEPALVVGLEHEVEGERRDQHPRAERHDARDDGHGHAREPADDGAHEQCAAGDESGESGRDPLGHEWSLRPRLRAATDAAPGLSAAGRRV